VNCVLSTLIGTLLFDRSCQDDAEGGDSTRPPVVDSFNQLVDNDGVLA